MPAVSKKQLRFFAVVASGKAREGHKGLSRAEAAEAVHATKSAKSLPERAGGKMKKLAKRRKKS